VLDSRYLPVAGSESDPDEAWATIGSPLNMFSIRQQFQPAGGEGQYEFRSALILFGDEEGASAYIADRLEENLGSSPDIEERDAPRSGDEAVAITNTADDGIIIDLVYIRVGSVVVRIHLFGQDAPFEVTDAFAEMQVDCLETGEICEPIDVSAELPEIAATSAE
jgi:hypothetical protein